MRCGVSAVKPGEQDNILYLYLLYHWPEPSARLEDDKQDMSFGHVSYINQLSCSKFKKGSH